MGGVSPEKKRLRHKDDFTDLVFSWSLEDIFDENLYKDQVEKIPVSFESVEHYLGSFVFPLLEETRARLASSMEIINRAPFSEVVALEQAKPYTALSYQVKVDFWRNRLIDRGRELYRILPGDVLVISDSKPETVADLRRKQCTWNFASITGIEEDEIEDTSTSTKFSMKSSRDIEVDAGEQKPLYVVFLTNITTNKRIWSALHMLKNLKVIQKVLCTNDLAEESCEFCPAHHSIQLNEKIGSPTEFKLDESQTEAIMASLHRMKCNHRSYVELIWGPPGTGKTRTISVMLFALLRMNYRVLSCAPTNVAVTELASRVVKLVKDSFNTESSRAGGLLHPLGDVLLFGSKDRMKVGSDIEEVYLDYRVERLMECLQPLTGWNHCIDSMIDFLEDCLSNYKIFVENKLININKQTDEEKIPEDNPSSLLEFARARFKAVSPPLKRCMMTLCTHVPRSFILEHNFQNLLHLICLLESMEILLFQERLTSDELEEIFSVQEVGTVGGFLTAVEILPSLACVRSQCLNMLKVLRASLGKLSLPNLRMDRTPVVEFCYCMASLIFCTASSSYRLHSVDVEPLNLVVIDEAAQLKECESIIPLQLEGLRHAILVGDECQLPATVNSKVSDEAGFGRSLFERLSLLEHPKHLLNVQYRMHPSISGFPNSKFYNNMILDAPNVRTKSYERNYLPGRMFGPYSFINVFDGREEQDDDEYSRKNMVEVAVVTKIVHKLYKAWDGDTFLSIGVISPYAAQVAVIQDKLHHKYKNLDKFLVKVKSIDGFQGGEEDIIIISAVRANNGGSIGFLSSPLRTNVALTRARHCLWILGNGRTLVNNQSVWRDLIRDAEHRRCFFSAEEDSDISKTILDVKKELDQLDDLLNPESVIFKTGKWKVLFSDNFRKSFAKLVSKNKKKSVIKVLLNLASGWRPKRKSVDLICESSSNIVKQFKVEGVYVVCSTDIVKESHQYKQVLKVWDVLPLDEIPKLLRRLDSIFVMYTDNFINCCKEKCLEGNLEAPKSWPASSTITRYKNLNDGNLVGDSNGTMDGRSYVENSRVSESLLLMKFYSLSTGVVNHLLSDQEGGELDLPFEVTDEEQEIIQFSRSSFILGRSGTGKTTVLTMKLFQKEQIHHLALEGFTAAESSDTLGIAMKNKFDYSIADSEGIILRQLFVTVSPKLCYAVKQHVSRLKSFVSSGKLSSETSKFDLEDMDEIEHFRDIPDSFVDIPAQKYPLVITFQKFLMMLDGTLGDSYFERFHEMRNCFGENNWSSKSVALQTFIRMKEVNFEKFSFSYWPHFNAQLTKNLDPSRVFTEIISHIKGGLQVGESDGKLSRQEYVLMSDSRASTLNAQKREDIYSIFQDYEKMKMEHGEFDLADFVMNLHLRLKNKSLDGDKMDFVYIDEVQDLTMKQIALFKYICKNVNEGFVFSGDTAQTIARGIDFRFEDIRSLFYSEFVGGSENESSSARKEKGLITEMFYLHQNFRTHAGVLRLAQSVVDLLYHFFRQSVDFLKPEISLIYGEAPVLLEPGSDENAIVTIFGNSENAGGKIVGFGAEQVILVRNDSARKEISKYVGNHALVLTIVECKGLEFQDVLLYNFFGSSPLRNQWRVIYEYMEENNLLDSFLRNCFPNFNHSRHSILCSELKQLYVAITRTRQRLWICENVDEFSKPMFDYWKKLCLVQVKKVDDSLAQAMQMASSPAEWKSRGIKLYWEKNYEMATLCFERAGDITWEKRAKAAGLRATAGRVHNSNPKEASTILREAAEIFDSIGRAESAAECFCELEEYERAGNIYLEKCGEAALEKAGECFTLAGCYEQAAKVYSKGNYFSQCLSVCTKGKLFDLGLHYIKSWKHRDMQCSDSPVGKDIEKIEQDFLESCSLSYYEAKDIDSMMKYVRAFISMDSRRNFLKSIDCLDKLLLLEEESGNFKEAAEIAKLRGDHLLEADLLAKAGNPREACSVILWYVLPRSLWGAGSRGWPLKRFAEKEEVLKKAISFAEQDSDQFYELVCTEAKILSHENLNLPELYQYLEYAQKHKVLRVELLSMRKLLDAHLHSRAVEYEWEDKVLVALERYSEDKILPNQVSVGTLLYFWNLWKENMLNMLQYFECIETQNFSKYIDVGEFCLNYFGVWRQINNVNITYVLLNPDAEWVKKIDRRSMRQTKNLLSIDARHFSSAARSHCRAEVVSVGLKVLETLEALYNLSLKSSFSLFRQSLCLVHIYQETKFLLGSFENSENVRSKLHRLLGLSTKYFENVFPLDCHKALVENMISLRQTEISRNLLEEVLIRNICAKGELTYGQIGRVMMIWLGFGSPTLQIYQKIAQKFDKNFSWKAFIQILYESMQLGSLAESPTENSVNRCRDLGSTQASESSGSQNGILVPGSLDKSGSNILAEAPKKLSLTEGFFNALRETYNANWRVEDYISPNCFLYLVDRLLIFVCHSKPFFFTTKYSFVEWLIYLQSGAYPSTNMVSEMQLSPEIVFDFVIVMAKQFLYRYLETAEWIRRSNVNFDQYHSLLVLRLVVVICLLCLNSGKYFDVLSQLLAQVQIRSKLPRQFVEAFRCSTKRNFGAITLNIIAEAFKRVGNPVVIVKLREDHAKILCPDAVSVDMRMTLRVEDIMQFLFPKTTEFPDGDVPTLDRGLPSTSNNRKENVSDLSSNADRDTRLNNDSQGKTQMKWTVIEDTLKLKSVENKTAADLTRICNDVLKIKVELEEIINSLAAGLAELNVKKSNHGERESFYHKASSWLEELQQLYSLFDCSDAYLAENKQMVWELVKRIQSRWPMLETFLNELAVSRNGREANDTEHNLPPNPTASGSQNNDQSKAAESNKGKGKNKNKNKSKKGKRR